MEDYDIKIKKREKIIKILIVLLIIDFILLLMFVI